MADTSGTAAAPLDRESWLAGLEATGRRDDAARLLQIYGEVTGWQPQLWSGSIAGFGRYSYRYASGHGGESLACGFAPRKAELVLYGLPDTGAADPLFHSLGKHRRGKGCLYLRRMEGVNEGALRGLIRAGLDELGARWTILPG